MTLPFAETDVMSGGRWVRRRARSAPAASHRIEPGCRGIQARYMTPYSAATRRSSLKARARPRTDEALCPEDPDGHRDGDDHCLPDIDVHPFEEVGPGCPDDH